MPSKWTGERMETFVLNDSTLEHLHRYALVMGLVKDMTVLDIACGEGYGTTLLADAAAAVVGIDIDANTIQKAAQKYQKQNLTSTLR